MGDVVKTPPRSDDLFFVRTVTATQASRSFAALLDEVEQGQTVIVTRGGRRDDRTSHQWERRRRARIAPVIALGRRVRGRRACGPRIRRFQGARVARRLILDTGVLITVERSTPDLRSVIGDDDYVVIAAITVAELRAGIEFADERNRTRRAEFVSHLLELIPVEFYDLSIAEAHGRLMAHVHRTGTRRVLMT